MKLFEILQTTFQKVKSKNPSRVRKNVKDLIHQGAFGHSKNSKPLGTGSFATVIAQHNKPGVVLKMGTATSVKSDAYYQYITRVIKNERAASNPYLPRVYRVKQYMQTTYVIEMERLDRFEHLDNEELLAIGDKMFFNFEEEVRTRIRNSKGMTGRTKQRRNHMIDIKINISDERKHYQVENCLLEKLQDVFGDGGDVVNIRDPKLKEAVMIVKNAMSVNDSLLDIEARNIMIRRTSTGPQLVITDPIA